MKKLVYIFIFFYTTTITIYAQYAPAAGEEGSSAIHKDSSIFIGWAVSCEVERGYVKLSDTTFTYEENNRAAYGNDTNAIAKADGKLISLGDNGKAVLTFEYPIINGEGADFAVFENSFKSQESPYNYFLELAFVEVSSDGVHFVRFPSTSETQTTSQIETFGQLDPTQIHNLAGKYIVNYGTPFDLDDLQDSTEIDLQNITHIKIIDVVGSIDPEYASYDALGDIINDPYPTPFASCGFDLDAVGVIHSSNEQTSSITETKTNDLKIFPNPIQSGQALTIKLVSQNQLGKQLSINFYDLTGKLIHNTSTNYQEEISINMPNFVRGIYFVEIPELSVITKIIVGN